MLPSQFTDCWADDERMNFLFSAFPANRSVNPHHWDTKMSFWKKLINDMCMGNTYGYMSWENLFSHLSRNGKQPLGLQTVFDDMVEKGEIFPTTQYTRDIHANESWVGWGLNWCVKKPATWMAHKVLSPIKTRSGQDMKKSQFVMISVLEQKCDDVVSKFHEYAAKNEHNHEFLNVVTYSQLQELTKDILCDTESVDLVLATLRKNRMVEIRTKQELLMNGGDTSYENGSENILGEKYIKFAKFGDKKVIPFSDVDIGILQLCETRTHLQKVIDNTLKEMEECTNRAKEFLKNKQRTVAKSALRKKKKLELSLEKKEQHLCNIGELLESLQQCKTDKMVMNTFKTAVTAYKEASKGLSLDEVQSTMDDVANVLDTQEEVNEILSGPVSMDGAEDLEAELAALVDDQSNASDLNDICNALNSITLKPDSFPNPPTHSPTRLEKKDPTKTYPERKISLAS